MVVAKSKNNSSSKSKYEAVHQDSSSEVDSHQSRPRHRNAHGLIHKIIEKKQAETPPGSMAPKQSVLNYYDLVKKPKGRTRKATTRYAKITRTIRKFRLLLATFLLILYVAGGAVLFWQIEHRSKEHYAEHTERILEKSRILYEQVQPSKCGPLRPDDTVETNACLKVIYDAMLDIDPPSKTIETFLDGLSYVITSITTIGYGNLICYTVTGKLVTVAYGIVGIGFLIYVLRNNGKMMLWFCNKVLKYSCQLTGCCQEAPRMTVTKGIVLLLVFWTIGTLGVAIFEEFPFWDAIYFSFVTFSTVGYGDFVPTGHVSTAIILTLHFIDLSLISMVVALVHESIENNFMQVLEILDEGYRKKTMGMSPGVSSNFNDMTTATAREKTPHTLNKS